MDMEIKDRVMGIENEYPFLFPEHPLPPEPAGPNEAMLHMYGTAVHPDDLKNVLESRHATLGLFCGQRLWFSNGGCVYPDMQKLEWASPESRRVRDVVLYNKVGERIVDAVLNTDCGGDSPCKIFKTTVAPLANSNGGAPKQYTSMGSHENYMMYGLTSGSDMSDFYPLAPFLITRQLYGGSGWWDDLGHGPFRRSQRAAFIKKLTEINTTSDKMLFCQRGDAFSNCPGLGRLHLILGDANMLEYAIFLKIGATKLMLSLLENKLLPKWVVSSLRSDPDSSPDNAAEAFGKVAEEPDPNKKMLLIRDHSKTKWQRMSPLSVQEYYLELARNHVRSASYPSEESEHETQMICAAWDETLSALARGDNEHLYGRVDWWTKARLVERIIERDRKNGRRDRVPEQTRATYDVLYHAIAEKSVYNHLVRTGAAKRIVTDTEIDTAVHEPPPRTPARGTRASIRGYAVGKALRTPLWREYWTIDPSAEWSYIGIRNARTQHGGAVASYPMNDPLTYQIEDLDKLLDTDLAVPKES